VNLNKCYNESAQITFNVLAKLETEPNTFESNVISLTKVGKATILLFFIFQYRSEAMVLARFRGQLGFLELSR